MFRGVGQGEDLKKSKPLRILHLVGWYFPDSRGGTETYVHNLARDLIGAGITAYIAAPSRDATSRSYKYDGVDVYRYPINKIPSSTEISGDMPPAHFEDFKTWIDKQRPDIVHLHSVTRECGYYHARYVRSLNIPLVITYHVPWVTCVRGTMLRWGKVGCDGEMHVARCTACRLHSRGVSRIFGWLIARLPQLSRGTLQMVPRRLAAATLAAHATTQQHRRTRELLAMAEKVVALSVWTTRVLSINGIPSTRIVLSRHGLPVETSNSTVDDHSPAANTLEIGYLGRLHPEKGVHVVIAAIRATPNRLPIRLHIYGIARNEEQEIYAKTITKLADGDDRITFHGELPMYEHRNFFNRIHVLAVPSLCQETGPLVVLEAFASGVPVVGSSLGGILELVTNNENGLLVEPGNVKAWKNAFHQTHDFLIARRGIWKVPAIRTSSQVAADMITLYEDIFDSKSPQYDS